LAFAFVVLASLFGTTVASASDDQPAISGFTPGSGPVGTDVAITGNDFTNATDVQFGGVGATFTVADDQDIDAIVPSGAVTGPVSVVTPDGTATSDDVFTVTGTPSISGFDPQKGAVGREVTISGADFTNAIDVQFAGTSATFTVTDDQDIDTQVPDGATTGPISVVTPDGTATSDDVFTVSGTPSISGFSPEKGQVGTDVAISGTDFTGATDVQFSGISASFTVQDDQDIDAQVPDGAASGPISVVTPDGTATSTDAFTVAGTPSISGFAPAQGPVGTQVAVSGTDFTEASDVEFSGVSATFTVQDDHDLNAVVPAGASTGVISVVTPDGTSTTLDPFTVAPPNIVFILTDDQRRDELQHMPNLQSELLDHGIRFPNGFVSNPLCCPSRTTILTGLYSSHTGVWSNVVAQHGGWKTFHDLGGENHTIATVLHAAGYRTGLIGKYLNGYSTKRTSWVPPGWDVWNALTTLDYYGPTESVNGRPTTFSSSDYQTDILGKQAVDFITGTPANQPLFLYWAPHAPHLPSTPLAQDQGSLQSVLSPWRPPSYNEADVSDKPWYIQKIRPWSTTKRAKWDAVRESMYESLIDVDRWLDNIVNALQQTGRLNNTLIVFTSDNGFLLGEHRWTAKVVPYEESIRVPWIVRWDGANFPEAGGTDNHLMLNTDFAPTFADIAGTSMGQTDGSDFVDLASHPSIGSGWRTSFLVEHGGQMSGDSATGISYCAVRNEGAMYAEYWNGFEELYDLTADPNELQNVAGESAYAPLQQELHEEAQTLCNPPPPGFTWPAP
jgi:arylsulfatase A-like enzyme